MNTEGFPLPSPSLQFPLCAWNCNSTTILCLWPIYLFICLFVLAWGDEIHTEEVFLAFLQKRRTIPPVEDIFQSLLLLPNCWSIRMQLSLIYQCAFTSEAIAFTVKRSPPFYFVNTYSQSVKNYFPTAALCKIFSSSRKRLSSLAESSYKKIQQNHLSPTKNTWSALLPHQNFSRRPSQISHSTFFLTHCIR